MARALIVVALLRARRGFGRGCLDPEAGRARPRACAPAGRQGREPEEADDDVEQRRRQDHERAQGLQDAREDARRQLCGHLRDAAGAPDRRRQRDPPDPDRRPQHDRRHAPAQAVFRRWLGAEHAGVDQILTFDNHGKKIDYCAAAKVMLAKNPSDAADPSGAGSRPGEDQGLFSGASSQASATVKKLNPQMRAFLLAAGVRRSVAVQLTK